MSSVLVYRSGQIAETISYGTTRIEVEVVIPLSCSKIYPCLLIQPLENIVITQYTGEFNANI